MSLIGQIGDTWISNVAGIDVQQFGSWTLLSGVAYYRTEIDLRGLNIQDKTFFPTGAMIQGAQELVADNYSLGESVTDTVLVSTVPLNDDDITNSVFGYIPGMMTSEYSTTQLGTTDAGMDLQNIVFGQNRVWVFDSTTIPYMRLHSQNNFGANVGVASETLYCYRILRLPAVPDASIQSNPIAIVLGGVVDEEKDLSRLMRMKRNTRIQP